ncbi:glutaredoxin family protein [Bacillus spongiae]|uniref:Glutaredoxin family protein n=1 Tax=Bacillus spongiae TaxID=2683610 RepID=A0ABU8H9U2_9BACI
MNKVVIYTQPDCPPCEIVKLFLKDQGISYVEKNIKEDKKAKRELIHELQSFSTPTTIVNDTVIKGFQLEEIQSALQN